MQPELQGEDRLGAVVERACRAGLHVSGMWGPTAAPCQSERHREGEYHIQERGDAVKGFYDALARAHLPFEIICDDMLAEGALAGCATLVLPNVSPLSDEQIETIRRFIS
jgi:hypothetical protein